MGPLLLARRGLHRLQNLADVGGQKVLCLRVPDSGPLPRRALRQGRLVGVLGQPQPADGVACPHLDLGLGEHAPAVLLGRNPGVQPFPGSGPLRDFGTHALGPETLAPQKMQQQAHRQRFAQQRGDGRVVARAPAPIHELKQCPAVDSQGIHPSSIGTAGLSPRSPFSPLRPQIRLSSLPASRCARCSGRLPGRSITICSALYELRTSGPATTSRKPRAMPSSRISSNSAGDT